MADPGFGDHDADIVIGITFAQTGGHRAAHQSTQAVGYLGRGDPQFRSSGAIHDHLIFRLGEVHRDIDVGEVFESIHDLRDLACQVEQFRDLGALNLHFDVGVAQFTQALDLGLGDRDLAPPAPVLWRRGDEAPRRNPGC